MIPRWQIRESGFTLIELLMTIVIGSVLVIGVSNVLIRTLNASESARSQNELTRQARFAMQRIVQSVALADEDWEDSIEFYLSSDDLVQRTPVTWEDSTNDYIEEIIATQVTDFSIERSTQNGNRPALIAITLQLSGPDQVGEVRLSTQMRAGIRL